MNNKPGFGGVDVAVLLALTFTALRLGGQVDWAWYWLVSPVWVFLLYVLVLAGILHFIQAAQAKVDAETARRRARESATAWRTRHTPPAP